MHDDQKDPMIEQRVAAMTEAELKRFLTLLALRIVDRDWAGARAVVAAWLED
jgi:hypothetical protein